VTEHRGHLHATSPWSGPEDEAGVDSDANRIEWLWRALRRSVTHTHQRQTLVELVELVADADRLLSDALDGDERARSW
jgi:hypothetical protein